MGGQEVTWPEQEALLGQRPYSLGPCKLRPFHRWHLTVAGGGARPAVGLPGPITPHLRGCLGCAVTWHLLVSCSVWTREAGTVSQKKKKNMQEKAWFFAILFPEP